MSKARTCRLVVLISGGGTNLQALIDSCQSRQIGCEIAAVISNRPGVYGLERASQAGVDTAVVDHTGFASREAFDQSLLATIENYSPDLVILAGFMRILTPGFVRHFEGRMLNIHPSLLPKFPGLDTHQRAIDDGESEHGATVHFVTEELDGGPPVLQAKVPVLPGDDADTLAARVLAQEHRIYPMAAAWFAAGRLQLLNGTVMLDGASVPNTGVDFAAASGETQS